MGYLIRTKKGERGPYTRGRLQGFVDAGKLPETATVVDERTGAEMTAADALAAGRDRSKASTAPRPKPGAGPRTGPAPRKAAPRPAKRAPRTEAGDDAEPARPRKRISAGRGADRPRRTRTAASERVPAQALPPLKNRLLAAIIIPIITFGAFMEARDAERGIQHEYHGRRAGQKAAVAAAAKALGPGGSLALGGIATLIAGGLLFLRIQERGAAQAAQRTPSRRRPVRSDRGSDGAESTEDAPPRRRKRAKIDPG